MTILSSDFNGGFARTHRCLTILEDDRYSFFIPKLEPRVRLEATIGVRSSLYAKMWWAADGRSYVGGLGPVKGGVLVSADLDAQRSDQAADDVWRISFGFDPDEAPQTEHPPEVWIQFSLSRAPDAYGTTVDRVLPIGHTRFPYRLDGALAARQEHQRRQEREFGASAFLDLMAARGYEGGGLHPLSGYRHFLLAAITELDSVSDEANCS